jgi:CRP/FNR family transcriptional regulator, cyclic AMP receptor protein
MVRASGEENVVAGKQNDDAAKVAEGSRAEWPRNSFLAELTAPALQDFLSAGELVRFRSGEVLIDEGGAGNEVFLLLDAGVKVTTPLDNGGHALLAIRVGGDVVGEIAVMDGGERTARVSAFAHEPVNAVRLGRGGLHGLLRRHPQAAISLASAVSRKLRSATRRRVDISTCPVQVRIARAVLELAEDYGRPTLRGTTLIRVNFTQAELGTLVGASEATVQRELRSLRNEGLVGNAGRRLVVPDMAALRSAARLA